MAAAIRLQVSDSDKVLAPYWLYLGLLYRMAADDHGGYPIIRSSVMYLSSDRDGTGALLRYDYERDKADDYPEAHLQVCATSEE